MRQLFANHLERELPGCALSETKVDQGEMHEGFCCTIKNVAYIRPDSHIPLAVNEVQTFLQYRKPPISIIRALRVGIDVYLLRMP